MDKRDRLRSLMDSHHPTPPSPPDEWAQIASRLSPTWWRRPQSRFLLGAVAAAAAIVVFLAIPTPPSTQDPEWINTQAYFDDEVDVPGDEYLTLVQSL